VWANRIDVPMGARITLETVAELVVVVFPICRPVAPHARTDGATNAFGA